MTISLTDGSGSTGLMRLRLPDGTTVASAQAAAEGLIAALLPLTDCGIARYSVSYLSTHEGTIVPLSTLPASPIAEFFFSLTGDPDHHATLRTLLDPTWLETTGPLAGYAIDMSNAEVMALAAELVDNGWCDPFGVAYAAMLSGFKREVI